MESGQAHQNWPAPVVWLSLWAPTPVEPTMALQERREPIWLLFLLGWVAADAARLGLPSSDPPAVVPAEPAVPDLGRMSPRELRRVPGIGERRALAIAQARWEHAGPGPLLLGDVPGIGPATLEGVRAWLAANGAAPAGSGVAAGTVDSPDALRSPVETHDPARPQSRRFPRE